MATEVAERNEDQRKRTGPLTFLREVRAEARKITWATRQDTIVSTIMVLIMVVLAAVFFFVVDMVMRLSVGFLLGLGN